MNANPGRWQQWLQQPQRTTLHGWLFQVHFWIGTIAGVYVTVVRVTGSIVVFRNQLVNWAPMTWLVKLHTNLLAGSTGRAVNGVAGVCLTLLCLTGAIMGYFPESIWHCLSCSRSFTWLTPLTALRISGCICCQSSISGGLTW